jgi:hypothetical protein
MKNSKPSFNKAVFFYWVTTKVSIDKGVIMMYHVNIIEEIIVV